ncbi:hybrid sensor histidine kinase/response regulator transcription factor [Streptomyces sp. NPDC057877]|uniref:helix-turn-helix transcriptional regulator n=1 Tax=Streptomyces sp. NPDC057877 TaxID=3346269 RepID=UPI0036B78136
MHDVLAHRLTLLSMHAGALEFHPTATRSQIAEAAGVMRRSASQALEERQDVLKVLRTPAVATHAQPPQPQLADIGQSIDEACASGAVIDLRELVEGRTMSADMTGRTAYRVVQEALTNHRKHAPGTRLRLTVAGGAAGGLTSTAVNALPKVPARERRGQGHGLVGMSERVHLAGGHIRHDRTDAEFRLELLERRELEVALAVGQGMTNAEIAAHAYMSLPTVKAHVSHILTKLDLNNRVQIALLVYQAGLV